MKSRANRTIIEHLRGLPQVTVNDIYEHYPDFFINVAREKRLLLQHDIVVFQHPFYWYSMPPLQKQWFDDVFELDFAYGEHGDALKDKKFMLSLTTGGSPESYHVDGMHGFPIENFLHPYKATAALCGMRWMPPMILHSARNFEHHEIVQHAEYVRRTLLELSES